MIRTIWKSSFRGWILMVPASWSQVHTASRKARPVIVAAIPLKSKTMILDKKTKKELKEQTWFWNHWNEWFIYIYIYYHMYYIYYHIYIHLKFIQTMQLYRVSQTVLAALSTSKASQSRKYLPWLKDSGNTGASFGRFSQELLWWSQLERPKKTEP